MNRYFEFSRRQLYFVTALCLSAVGMSGYLTLSNAISSALDPSLPPVHAGPMVDIPEPSPSILGHFIIDPNSAPMDSLELLPGVGPTKAAAIVACRDTVPFTALDDLLQVDGIGPKTLEKMRPFLKVLAP